MPHRGGPKPESTVKARQARWKTVETEPCLPPGEVENSRNLTAAWDMNRLQLAIT